MAAERKARVVYTEDEWDRLASLVLPMRINDPYAGMGTLISRAMEQMPKDRRRSLATTEQMEPIVSRMQEEFRSMRDDAQKYPAVFQQLQASQKGPTLEERELADDEVKRKYGRQLLESMPISEIIREYPTEDVLDAVSTPDIIGAAARRFAGDILDSPLVRDMKLMEKPNTLLLNPAKTRQPRVFVVGGPRSAQDQIVGALGAFADLRFYFDKEDPQEGGDIYVVWQSICSHSQMRRARRRAPVGGLVLHRGGVEKMVEASQLRIQEWYNGKK